jgi:dTDP-4-dehydrorhamnose reductase
MLGRDLVRAAEFTNHEVTAASRLDLDVTDRAAVDRAVRRARPEVVVNCAAYTDVDGAEDDLADAMKTNAGGARSVAAAAAEVGAQVLYPSTDYVFDGTKPEPYVESDEPRPQSVYAQSKLAGEHESAEANPRHHIVRASWLFGVGGRNFVETMLELAREHGEVVVVRDQVGSPTYAGHLAEGAVRLLDSRSFGIHHMAAGGECSWAEFAQEIFKQAGVQCRVISCTTGEFGRPAPRPAYSVLASESPEAIRLPHWKEGLRSYLAERSAAEAQAGGVARERA